MKKGFTLIELLAVIAILAIILLIAIPSIIDTITNSKTSTFKSQVQLIIDGVDQYLASNTAFDPTTINKDNIDDLLNIDNTNLNSVIITNPGGIITVDIIGSGKWANLEATGTSKNITVVDITNVDQSDPVVAFGTNGNVTYAKTRSTTVTVTDDKEVNASSLKYQWTTSTTAPTEGSFSTSFTNGATISTPSSVSGGYYLWILAKDTANKTVITKSNVFNLDNTAPVITMTGSTPVSVAKNGTYTDAGATATDNIDGSLSVNSTSTVVTTVIGTYTVTYNATDSSGNTATTVVRTVNVTGTVSSFSSTGAIQTFTTPTTGKYKIELWGAQGSGNTTNKGSGAYVSGEITLTSGTVLYVHVGGFDNTTNYSCGAVAYNVYNGVVGNHGCAAGGAATDIRVSSGAWTDTTSLNSRIMVAAGGGGALYSLYSGYGGAGGGISGSASNGGAAGGTQTSGGDFGIPTYGTTDSGNGYYSGTAGSAKNAGGGSSYISGHTGCVAITSAADRTPLSGCTTGNTTQSCSYHYSGYTFTNTTMIDGNGYAWTNTIGSLTLMPSKTTEGAYYSSGVGNTGTGYARISYVGQ